MTKSELWLLLQEKEKQLEKAKTKRIAKTLAGFTIAYYVTLYLVDKPSGLALLGNILVSLVIAGIHVWINASIFGQLALISEEESKMLNDLRKRLSEME